MLSSFTNQQLKITSGKKANTTEKLSSGYRINRASDDAAGLSISEKMRSQIRGLNQASRNAQDGLSLIQTADGALGEVHNMLQRIRELSVQGANDTNTTVDRDAVQEEISALTKEIDNVAKNTEFNSMKLLDGTSSGASLSQAAKDKFISWLNGSWLQSAAQKILDTTGWTLQAGTTLNVKFADIGSSAVAQMSGYFLGDDLTLTVNTEFLKDGLVYNGKDGPTLGGIPADRLITHEFTHGLMFDNVSTKARPDYWFIEGLAEGVHGASDIRYSSYETAGSTNYSAINQSIQNFDFKNDQYGYDVYTVGYLATSYLKTKMGLSQFQTMLGEMDQSDETFHDLVAKYTLTSYDTFMNQFKSDANTAASTGNPTDFENFLQTKCGINITDGLADPLDGNDANSSDVVNDLGGAVAPSGSTSTINASPLNINVVWGATNTSQGITLQIGAQEGQSMKIDIPPTTASALDIEKISVASNLTSQSAITTCDKAIKTVSDIRSQLGAFQNRIEHVINNLDNTSENTQYAESRIRDIDMAAAMVEFSKYDILQQAGQSMLSQANKNPQSILSLLQ